MYNILICDDDKDIVNALKIYLQNPDYRLLEAYNGAEAVEAVHRETVHLVLLDIMMPQMDGITAMAKIRERADKLEMVIDDELWPLPKYRELQSFR